MPGVDLSNLKVADLKRELKERGLPLTGNKNELQERLQAAMNGEPLLEDASITGEDILDEEEGVLSDEEKILVVDENELLQSPSATPTMLLPKTSGESNDAVSAEDDILGTPTTIAKKVVLKRKISSGPTSTEATNVTAKENTEPPAEKVIKSSQHVPITADGSTTTATTRKLSELTMEERLELRAKKFGIDKTATHKDGKAITEAPDLSDEKQVELLKKRAERFGCVTSTNLVKLDAEEKLLKRKQRFGGDVQAAPVDTNSVEWAEKARKRLERFKDAAGAETKISVPEVVESTTPPPAAAAATAAASN